VAAGSAAQTSAPSVRLVASGGPVTLYESNGRVGLDVGVWVAAAGGTFELRASRADHDAPIGLTQVDATTGAVLRDLSNVSLQGFEGFTGEPAPPGFGEFGRATTGSVEATAERLDLARGVVAWLIAGASEAPLRPACLGWIVSGAALA
jgi:hypothetical protein